MNKTIATATGLALLAGGGVIAAPAQASMDTTMQIGITNDSQHAVYVVVAWERDSSGPSGPVSATAPPQGTNTNPWTYPKFPDGTNAYIEVDYEGSGDMTVTTKIYPDADHSFLIGTYTNTFHNGFWRFSDTVNSGTATDWIDAFNSGFGVDEFNVNLPPHILDPYYGPLANDFPVGAAVDVDVNVMGSAAPDDSPSIEDALTLGDIESPAPADTSDDTDAGDGTSVDDPNATVVDTSGDDPILKTRSKALATEHQVAAKHHTRVEKIAAKMHNKGGVLTVHAYGSDEDLAMARGRAVRSHLGAHLAKRGHVGTPPIYVMYAGDPRNKDVHVTVHQHPDKTLPVCAARLA